MLQVFSTCVYALLDLGSTLSFVTLLLALTFEILPKFLHDPIGVCSPLGENVRSDRVYKDFPIGVCGRTMCADLVELPLNDFDIVLCIDGLHCFYDCVDWRTSAVRFCFPNKVEQVGRDTTRVILIPLFRTLKPIEWCSRAYYVILWASTI